MKNKMKKGAALIRVVDSNAYSHIVLLFSNCTLWSCPWCTEETRGTVSFNH